jgi:pimeloyl-ACP methyl ester carboxylesterase
VPELRSIKPVPEGQPVGEVILVHGLGGDQEQTWRLDGAADRNWPGWLNEDLPSVRVRTLGYDAPISAWSRSNSALPLTELATACLAELQAKDVGAYPVVFICHSLGGLVVEQMIRHPDTYSGHGWEKIRDQIRGVSFFGTPHSGAKIANWAGFLNLIVRPTVSVEDMEHHTPALKDLNSWFRNYADKNLRRADGHVSVQAFRETEPYSGAVIVDEVSADPALPGIALITVTGRGSRLNL